MAPGFRVWDMASAMGAVAADGRCQDHQIRISHRFGRIGNSR